MPLIRIIILLRYFFLNIIIIYINFRTIWEFFMVIIFSIQFFAIPLDILKFHLSRMDHFRSTNMWLIFRNIFDILTLIDCFLNFITGYYDKTKKEVVMKPKEVAR